MDQNGSGPVSFAADPLLADQLHCLTIVASKPSKTYHSSAHGCDVILKQYKTNPPL